MIKCCQLTRIFRFVIDSKNAILRESVHNFTYAATMLSRRKQWVDSLECVWVAAVIVDLVFQCMPRYNSSPERLEQLGKELYSFLNAQ